MHRIFFSALTLVSLWALVACDPPQQAAPTLSELKAPATAEVSRPAQAALLPFSEREYSFGYWLNGMRKHADDPSADVLCLESGYFGFALDMADLTEARLGTFTESLDYREALEAGAERLRELKPVDLAIELEANGTVFRAVSCRAGEATPGSGFDLEAAWMWESGRLAQHYELKDLRFEDAQGRRLGANASLRLVGWPQSLSLTTEIAPGLIDAQDWHEGVVKNGLCIMEAPWKVPHDPRLDAAELTVECWVKIPENMASSGPGYLLAKNGNEDTHGHYNFKIENAQVSAYMNIAAGADGRRSINQSDASFKEYAWNHLAMTYDGNEMRFYINGTLQGKEALVTTRRPGQGQLVLGQRADCNGGITKAVYDQVRVWDRPLSQAELQAHAKSPESLPNVRGLNFNETFDDYGVDEVLMPEWSDVTMRIRLGEHQSELQVTDTWPLGEKQQLSLTCDLGADPAIQQDAVSIQVSAPGDAPYPVEFDPGFNCYVAEVNRNNRGWDDGYTDIRNYDEFDVVVENSGQSEVNVPLLFYLRNPANVTGMLPMLCDADGVPTGIPVQLSKNWHDAKMGAYFRGTMQLPAQPGRSIYKLRIAYGFYGTVPSVSHSQLSLVGYAGNGRWDQLAIGCWGETICFDMDLSCVDVAITDVRMLMSRKGKDGKKWNWTDAGWGGDWLCVNDAKGQKLLFSEMKTAYLAHGPCLSEVHYNGHNGSQREVAVQAKVQTLRTDDYARTFQTFKYTFDQALSTEDGWLFKMGGTKNSIVPKIAYGNADGLIREENVPTTLCADDVLLDRVRLEGAAPWWVGFPGGYLQGGTGLDWWGTGSRGWVIRSYRASFGGQVYTNPSISMPVRTVNNEGGANLDLLLTPPAGVTKFLPGDTIEMDIEWITFHREIDDYYGPNENYRRHLIEHPKSWKTIYREAAGNDLKVQVEGGTILHRYPIIIQAEQAAVAVQIDGGCGYVPIRFEGLESATGYTLYQIVDGQAVVFDQSVHGNDFWQTDYDAKSNRFKITFNLPLDGGGQTEWLLRRH